VAFITSLALKPIGGFFKSLGSTTISFHFWHKAGSPS
jgi:hypothetical protein